MMACHSLFLVFPAVLYSGSKDTAILPGYCFSPTPSFWYGDQKAIYGMKEI